MAFDQAFGTLDLQLYDQDRTLVADGQRQDNQVVAEWVVSSGMTYLIRVGATSSGKHPGYSLLVDGPGGIVPDRFEPNDYFSAAADLGRSSGTYERLSIHEPNNQDWYRWTAPANGAVTIELTYPLPLGDVDMALYNASQKLIASSSSDGDTERVAWPVVSGETYFIRAFAFREAVSPAYTMTVIAPASTTPLDCTGDGMVNIDDADCASLEMLDATLNAAGLVRGDADGDAAVQFGDFVILADNFGQPGQYTQGGFDKNGRVDFADFVILADNFEQQTRVE